MVHFSPSSNLISTPINYFLGSLNIQDTNTGLNDAKISKNGVAGTTCTGTPLSCTGTGCLLHTCTGTPLTCTGTAQSVPVHPTGFCPKIFDFGIFL